MEKYVKFLVSGGIAALFNVLLLYLLKDVAGFHYLIGSGIAFLFTTVLHFSLQRTWVFGDGNASVKRQFVEFTFLSGLNLLLNEALMYLFVSGFGIYYLVSQLGVRMLLAVFNFVVYEKWIFKKNE